MAMQYDSDFDDEDDNVKRFSIDDIEGGVNFPQTKCSQVANLLWLAALLGQATLITFDSIFARLSMMGMSA